MKKECTGCGKAKDLEEFNRLASAKDGRQSKCRNCFSEYNAARYAEQGRAIRKKVKAYREANPDKIRALKRTWKKTPAGKACEKRYQASEVGKAARRNGKNARAMVRRALQDGRLVKGPCARASAKCRGPIEGHHHKGLARKFWLDVEWLCKMHHRAHHLAQPKQ